MTAPALFSGQFFSALGWALFHFLWQGALVAALLGALQWLLRNRTPALRYALACGALATMLSLPVATTWSLAARGAGHSSPESAASTLSAGTLPLRASNWTDADVGRMIPETLRNRLETLRPWALSAWFAGVLFLSVRFLGGLAAARRLTRRGARPAPPVWQEALARMAARLSIARPVCLLESAVVKVPTAIGAFRPVILFPATVFLGLPTRGLEALLAHELAHVRRHDYLVNLLQTVVETLLFYHPAVWWVSARVRTEREQCCDDLAIAATGDPRTYARALMRLEEMRGAAPALAVAAGGGNLWKRVVRLLTQHPAEADRPAAWLAGALALATMVLLGAAARVGPENAWAKDSIATPEPDAVVHAFETPADRADPAEAAVHPDETPAAGLPESAADPEEAGIAEEAEEAEGAEEKEAAETPAPAVPAEVRALTDDELVAFRKHGVTPEFVRSIAALGYGKADPDDILALAIHGVTTADIAEMNRVFGRRQLDEHVSFKIHGVTPQEVRRLSALGLGKLSPDDVVSMKIHGVDAGYVERLRSAGYRQVSAEDAVSARIHGVSPEDAEGWSRLGFSNVSLDDLVGARIHGASPEFASDLRSLGFSNLSLDDIVAFRIHGVTTEFVREIRSLGYSDASPDELVDLRVHGVSAAMIRKENARAGRRLSLDQHVERCGEEEDDEN